MYSIVPLAGPDFFQPAYGLKPLIEVDGQPLLRAALRGRPWFQRGELAPERLIFILRDTDQTAGFLPWLRKEFPGCRWVVLSQLTPGALHSAMAGTALLPTGAGPVAVDLVDILYQSDFSPSAWFAADARRAAAAPFFRSTLPCYSYFRCAGSRVLEAAEKVVLSDRASAGTYLFRDAATLQTALAWGLAHPELSQRGPVSFVCPILNAFTAGPDRADCFEVTGVNECSKSFHPAVAGDLP